MRTWVQARVHAPAVPRAKSIVQASPSSQDAAQAPV